MGAASSGRITDLSDAANGDSVFLFVDANGDAVGTTPESPPLRYLFVEPISGRLYASGPKVDSAQNGEWDAYVYDAQGGSQTLIASCQQLECSALVLAASSRGDHAVLHSTPVSGVKSRLELVVTPADGTPAWTVTDPFNVSGAAFDADRNVVLVGTSVGGTFDGKALPAGPTIMKFTLDGKLLWIQQVTGSGSFESVGTSAIGTVVALGELQNSGSFAGTSLSPGLMLVTVEANGAPRWAKNVPAANGAQNWLAVDPSGKAAVMARSTGAAPYCGFDVHFYNLAGDLLWSRSFTANDCSTDSLSGEALAFSGHDLVVGGEYSGSVDFGTGTRSSSPGTGFLLKLKP